MSHTLHITETVAAIDLAAARLSTTPTALRRLFAVLYIDRVISIGAGDAADFARRATARLTNLVAGLDPAVSKAHRPEGILTALAVIAATTGEAEGGAAADAFARGYLQVLIAREEAVAEGYAEEVAMTFLANGRVPLPSPSLMLGHEEAGR